MANLREQSIWETGVYQIEENDPVHGGANGITNRPTKQLANRTVWLKNELASSVQAINASLANLSNNKADKALNLVAGNGLTGGGTLQASRTLTLGTPSQITATSKNSVTAISHTHAIDKASTTVAGIVQLNDTLASSATDQALTANQGKVLNDTKLGNRGYQTLNGQIRITGKAVFGVAEHWEKFNSPTKNGLFVFEVNPETEFDTNDSFRVNFKYLQQNTSGGGNRIRTMAFPSINKTESVAYQSWVEDNFVNHNEVINTLTATDTNKPLSATQGKILNDAKANKSTQFTAGADLTGGGDLSSSRSLSLGTPSKITATTTNTAVSNTHSHEIDKASTTTAGIVQLNDSLGSTSTTQALTAAQGKVLNENKLNRSELKVDHYSIKGYSTPTEFDFNSKDSIVTYIGSGNIKNHMYVGLHYSDNQHNVKNAPIPKITGSGEAIYVEINLMGFLSNVTCYYIKQKRKFVSTINWGLEVLGIDWKEIVTSSNLEENDIASASKLSTPRTISATGDAAWSVSFDGSSNASGTLVLANSGVAAGSYNAVTVDSKGRVTKGLTQTISLVTATSATGTTNVATNNSNTYLNIVNTGAGTSAAGSSTRVTGTNGITVSSGTDGVLTVSQTLTNNLTSTSTTSSLSAAQGKILKEQIDTKLDSNANAVSASKLHTSRTINGVAFDGTANITISDNTKVGKSGNDTIGGVKTFSQSPKAPTPATSSNDTTLATTAFVKSVQPQISVLTGTINHGGTLPLPSGYSESQCRFMVSVNKDNPNKSAWDINEQGAHFHYGFECWADGRVVHVGAYLGHYGSRTNFVAGVANYIVIGVR